MSRDVTVRGKLIPVDLEGMTVEAKALSLIPKDKHINVTEFYDSAVDYLTLELNYYFEKTSGILFEISSTEAEDDYFVKVTKNDDGSYDFLTRFYNGGCDLSEMLEEGLEDLAKG